MKDPLPTLELLAFTKVVDTGSVSSAAQALQVPRATIGRRLAVLERRLGRRLLRRTTRSHVLTEAGLALYPHARMVLDAAKRAEESMGPGDAGPLRGEVRVAVPAFVPPSFNAMVCDFLTRFPDVLLHVHLTNSVVDLRRDGYDLALRASRTLEPGLIARTLARDALVAVASPTYLATHGTPRSAKDLAKHRCLLDFAGNDLPQGYWPAGGSSRLHVDGVFFANSRTLLRDAATRGLGIAVLPMMEVRRLLDGGELVQVLPGSIAGELVVVIAHPEREFIPPQVRAFADALTRWAVAELAEVSPATPPRNGRPQASRPRKGKQGAPRRALDR